MTGNGSKKCCTPVRSAVLVCVCARVCGPKLKTQSDWDFYAFQNHATNTHALERHKAVKDKITNANQKWKMKMGWKGQKQISKAKHQLKAAQKLLTPVGRTQCLQSRRVEAFIVPSLLNGDWPAPPPQIIEVYGKSDDAQKYATAFTLNQNSYSKEEQSWKKPSFKYNN